MHIDHGNIREVASEMMQSEKVKDIKYAMDEFKRLGYLVETTQMRTRLNELSKKVHAQDLNDIAMSRKSLVETKEPLYVTLMNGYQSNIGTRVEITKFDNGYFCELLDEGDVDLDVLLTLINTRFEYPLMSTSFNEPFYIWFDGAVSYTTDVNSGEYFEVDDTESLNRALDMFDKNQRLDIVTKLYKEKYI